MCTRTTNDPLLRMFLDRYSLHLLSIPRENAAVGELCINDGKRTSTPGSVCRFLEPTLKLPEVRTGESMADVAGTFSDSVSTTIGISLLESFLAALGAGAALTSAKAGFETRGARTMQFRFSNATRDSVDAVKLGSLLVPRRLVTDNALFNESSSYYIVTGVARSRSISIKAHDDRSTAISLGAEAVKAASADAAVKVSQAADGEITFDGKKTLAFGVELYELTCEPSTNRLRLRLPKDVVKVRAAPGGAPVAKPAFIGGSDGNVFLNLA